MKLIVMVEGKGFCGRRVERLAQKKVSKLIENRNNIVVIPDHQKK